MNILMINGTMRKSSTYRLAKMFVERVTLSHDMVIELFLPKDMPEFCRGCGRCITQGAKKCPDYLIYLKRITRLIDEADLLVFTTPVYVYHATGQMKALLDHYGYRWMVHRPEASMFKKQAVCFSTAAGAGMKSALKDITDSLKWWGVGRIYTYGVAVRSMDWDEISKPIKDKIDENVNRLMAKIIHDREKVTPSLYARVLFYAMRYMHSRTFMQQIDTDYWREKGWLGDKRPWVSERPKEEPEQPGQQMKQAARQGQSGGQEHSGMPGLTEGYGHSDVPGLTGGDGQSGMSLAEDYGQTDMPEQPRESVQADMPEQPGSYGQSDMPGQYAAYVPAGRSDAYTGEEFSEVQDFPAAKEEGAPQ